jgi:hypothetical protein
VIQRTATRKMPGETCARAPYPEIILKFRHRGQ